MPLYHVQDPDRPLFVIARSWQEAVDRAKVFWAHENACEIADVDEPVGVILLTEDDDLLPESARPSATP